MYANDNEQRKRKQDYERYQKLTEKGYSITDEVSTSNLYTVKEDPFNRAYYEKPLGQSIHRHPLTGQKYTQEEWAIKEFITDNKTQLVVKVSADLVVGKDMDIVPEEGANEVTKDWVEDFIKRNKFKSRVYEGAMQVSSKGDYFFEITVGATSGKVEVRKVDPYYVDIKTDHGNPYAYEIASVVTVSGSRKGFLGVETKKNEEYVQKKTHYAGYIVYELYKHTNDSIEAVPLIKNPYNKELIDRALSSPYMETYVSWEDKREVQEVASIYTVVEYTGIDTPLLIHWVNYRMFSIYGVSDAGMIESLQNALNNRKTQLNDVLDKHADPSMYGSDAYQDENGNLEMSGGGSRYFPVVQGGEVPGYLEWSGHLPEAQEEIDKLYESILENSEISPALIGKDNGGIESGRALMYKLMRSLCMKARKEAYMKEAIIEVFDTAQKLDAVWVQGNGVQNPNDPIMDFTDTITPVVVTTKSAIPVDRAAIIEDIAVMIDKDILSQETAVLITSKLFDEIDADAEILKLLSKATENFNKQKALLQAEVPDYLKDETRTDEDTEDGNGTN